MTYKTSCVSAPGRALTLSPNSHHRCQHTVRTGTRHGNRQAREGAACLVSPCTPYPAPNSGSCFTSLMAPGPCQAPLFLGNLCPPSHPSLCFPRVWSTHLMAFTHTRPGVLTHARLGALIHTCLGALIHTCLGAVTQLASGQYTSCPRALTHAHPEALKHTRLRAFAHTRLRPLIHTRPRAFAHAHLRPLTHILPRALTHSCLALPSSSHRRSPSSPDISSRAASSKRSSVPACFSTRFPSLPASSRHSE